ncbi:MAG: hypothetical protein KDI75_04470, partial [Xanthomonadales bacterium]|nr:hypothetical protein [Xanthomonadales bacterium]
MSLRSSREQPDAGNQVKLRQAKQLRTTDIRRAKRGNRNVNALYLPTAQALRATALTPTISRHPEGHGERKSLGPRTRATLNKY